MLKITWKPKSVIPDIDQVMQDVEVGAREVLLGLRDESNYVAASGC